AWHPRPLQGERLAGLRPGGNGDLDRPFQRRDLDSIPQRSLHHVDPQVEHHVRIVARELRVRLDAEDDIEIARLASAHPRLAFAADPYLRPGVDAGRALD